MGHGGNYPSECGVYGGEIHNVLHKLFLELTPNVKAQQAVRDINFINKAKPPSISKNIERDKIEPITAEKISLFTPGASPLSRQTNFKRK